jgi:signal transduction histidine kinase
MSCSEQTAPRRKAAGFAAAIANARKYINSKPDSALLIGHSLLAETEAGDNPMENKVKVLTLIGVAYDVKGEYDSSATYLFKAWRMAENLENADSLKSAVLSNMGILQFDLHNADEAINYYQQSLEYAKKAGDSISMANQLNNIGNAYMTIKGDLQAAVPYLEQCMDIGKRINYKTAEQVAGINLAMIHNELGEHDKAIAEAEYYIQNFGANIYADFTIAEAYRKKHEYDKALHAFNSLLQKPLNTREFELAIISNIADLYKQKGNIDSALVYTDKYHAVKDTIHDLQSKQIIEDLKIAYETEKKETKIILLEEEKELIKIISIIAIALLLSVAGGSLILYRYMRQKKQLAEQRVVQLEKEKQLVATQAVLDGETAERSRIAQDLHDGLGSMLTGVKLNMNELKKGATLEYSSIEQFNKALTLLDDSMRELRRVAHHLMPESLSRYGLKIALTDFCNSIPNVEFSYFGSERRLNQKTEVMIYRVMHELVNNAMKHSGASRILVQILQDEDRIAFTVEDNGCGFNLDAATKGMGLKNIRQRIASFGGVMDICTQPGNGTEVNVEFKLDKENS